MVKQANTRWNLRLAAIFAACCVAMLYTPSSYAEHQDDIPLKLALHKYYNKHIADFTVDEGVLDMLNRRTINHAALSRHDLIRLNERWETELKANTPVTLQQLLKTGISRQLRSIQEEASGLIINAALIDKFGISAGQTGASKLYWYTEDLVLHSLLRRRTPPPNYISDVLYNESGHYFYIRAYFIVPYNNNVAILIIDFDAEEIDNMVYKDAKARALEQNSGIEYNRLEHGHENE